MLADPILKHISDAKRTTSHDGKRTVFTRLLKELFNIELGELLPGIEAKLGSKIYGVKGSADLLFSNIAFEFKRNLQDEEELTDAVKNKLPKYLQVLHEIEPERKHIGIATDTIRFKAYSPILEKDKVVDLNLVGEVDLEKVTHEGGILWLESFLFSQPTIKPTAEDIKWRFGPGSPTHALSIEELEAMWKVVESYKDAKLRLNLWAEHMEMVYGHEPDPKAFIDQTYLVILVKLILYIKLSETKIVKKEEIERVLTGEYFRGFGILNLIEEDFFLWPLLYSKVKENMVNLACRLTKVLLRYDTTKIDEDLFKEIYQGIVSRAERHRVGEYYTPEWLCELTLREVLNEWKKEHKGIPRILDPACGSGTFLTNAVRLLREELKEQGVSPEEAIKQIFKSVMGIDINPLAVVIARANYILMFEELPSFRVTIPIYVADSIKLIPEIRTEIRGINVYSTEVKGQRLQVPARVATNREIFGSVLGGMNNILEFYKSKKSKKAAHANFEQWKKEVSPEEFEVLDSTLEALMKLVDEGEDSIWTFWLNNIHAPIAFKETPFDLVVGNPPWVAMRYFENKNYQDFLKELVLKYELLDSKEVELFTHMEIATLFFQKVVDTYMKERGVIGFVMPRSVLTGALQHIKFKSFKRPTTKLVKILDLEEVSPLFNVPSCVLVCIKGQETSYPTQADKYVGMLERKNERLSNALKILKISKYEYEPPAILAERSFYYDRIREGATIVPRAFWFIEFDVPPKGWVDIKAPVVKTLSRIQKKPPWADVELRGKVESNYIYLTLLGGDIIRFGYIELRPVILPIEPLSKKYAVLDVEKLINKGLIGETEWLEKAQQIWEKRATEKAKKSCPRLTSWLNYRNKLCNQSPHAKHVVLYNGTGTNIASCVVNKQDLPPLEIGKAIMKPQGFIVDYMSFFYESDDKEEAHYLCAILNSNILNEAIKPFQPKGLFGERHIQRRPFMFNIPKFERNNPLHAKLAELSKQCHAKVSSLYMRKRKTASARKEATKMVKKELEEIDNLVRKIIPQLG